MTILDLTILILATWRVTSLLYIEDGPYRILARLREYLGVYYDSNGSRQASTEIGKAFNCPACLSVWVGGFVALSYAIAPAWIWLPLALSAGAIVVEELVSNGES
jgi:hypothetical protein